MRIDGPQLTSSLSLNGTTITDLNVFVTTASFNGLTGSMATTGSNLFKGTQTLSGSIIPAVNNIYDLGSPTNQFRHVYISTGSLYIDGTKVLGSTSSELQITTDVGQSFKVLETGADTITLQSNDGNVTLTSTGGGDIVMDPSTGIIGLKGTVSIYTGNKIVSSDGNLIQFGNGIAITGSIVATGTNLISGSSQVLNGSGVWSGSAQLPSGIISSSTQLPSGIVSSSSQVTGYGFSTTGSNNFVGVQTITGSLYISQNLVVQGSSSLQDVTGSNVYIGTNKINLNTSTPSIRFGGISVFDSGSNFGESGSLLWDSQNNRWLYQHPASSGAPYKSAIVISGPMNSGSLGSEGTLTSGKIQKAVGDDHIGDSIINETGGGIGISGSLSITGSIVASGTSLWSGSGQLPSGTISGSAQVLFTGTTGYSTYLNQAVLTTSNPTFNSVISGDIRYNGTGYITYDVANSGTDSLIIRKYGTTVLTLNPNGYLGVNITPTYPLDVLASSSGTFNTIIQFQNTDYTSGNRSFLRVRQWASAGGSYSSYFGTGQDGNLYIIANNSARGGDLIINAGTGNVLLGTSTDIGGDIKLQVNGTIYAGKTGGNIRLAATTDAGLFTSGNNLYLMDWATATKGLTIGITTGAATFSHGLTTGGSLDVTGTGDVITVRKSNNVPAIAWQGATYKTVIEGGDNFNLYTGGVGSRIYVNSSGYVGVNTSSPSVRFEVKASGDEDLIVGRYSGGSAKLFYVYQSSADGYLELRTGADTTITKLSGYSGTPSYFYSRVGINTNTPGYVLEVAGPAKIGNSIINLASIPDPGNANAYMHIKTNLNMGGSGNIMYIMGGFRFKGYQYNSNGWGEGMVAFHNWSGAFYNLTVQNFGFAGFVKSPYVSSDGYAVFVVSSETYCGVIVDYFQTVYTFRYPAVTAYTTSNSLTGVY